MGNSTTVKSEIRVYNKRGTAQQWIKEGKQAAHWTRLSCHRFRANEVRLQLSVLAYTLGNLWRTTGAPDADRHVVADQPPAAPRQDRWAASETCPLLLVPAGREPSDPPPVWVDAPADLGAARAERLTDNDGRRPSLAKNGRNAGKVLENCERWRVRRPEFRSPWRAS